MQYYQKKGIRLGKVGFTKHGQKEKITAVNLDALQNLLAGAVTAGKVIQEGDLFVVDVEKLGFNKVLGSGQVGVKLKIKTSYITSKAEEKIKAAGGEVEKLTAEEEPKN